MPRLNLTDRTVKSLSTSRAQEEFWDAQVPGFGVRVTRRGRRSFVLLYRANGRKVRMTLGTYPALSLADARKEARQALGDVAKGGDPHRAKTTLRRAETFEELTEEYLERHAKRRKKSWKEDQRKIERELLPVWRQFKAVDINRRDVLRLVERIVDRGSPISANRTLALISRIFNFGIDHEIVEVNPAQRVRPPAKETPRDRVLTESEIRAVWTTLDDLDTVMAATFRMRLLTAQRGVEVMSMRWDHVDGDWWTIPAEVSKNGLSHRVYLSVQAQQILDPLRPVTGTSPWVFESRKKPGTHIKAIRKAAVQVADGSGVEFVSHDLRRTAASMMTSMGTSRLVVSKILNHVERGITAVYDRHSYDGEKQRALVFWGQRLEEIVAEAEPTTLLRIA